MAAQTLTAVTQSAEPTTPKLLRWLLYGTIFWMPYHRWLVFPDLGFGYVVDWFFIIPIIVLGAAYVYYQRIPLRLPLILPHLMIFTGSIIATAASDLDRVEALSTLLRDMYVWVFFYAAINVIRRREFLHRMIVWWAIVAMLESAIIFYAVTFTEGSGGPKALSDISDTSQLGSIETQGDALTAANLPSEFKQAKHEVKRYQTRGYLFFQPGSGLGTFANGDFTANYTAIAIFVALAIPASKKWHWLLKLAAMAFIFYACLSTGVSSQLPVIPIAGGVYLLLIGTPRQRIFWTTAGAAAALVGAFVYFSSPTFLGADILTLLPTGSTEEGAAESLTGISGGASDRIALVQDGFKEYSSHHVLGLSPHGMRSSGLEKNVHNEYASYLFERGPFGFVGLLMGIAIVFGLGIASMKTGDKTHRAVMGGLLAAYALFVINDIAHELSRQRDVWMLVVLIVAYADIELRRAWDRRQATLASRFPWAFTKPRPAVAAGGD